MDYKKEVLEHYGSQLETDYDEWSNSQYKIKYVTLSTADSYNIYHRTDGDSTIYWDSDIFYYAENCTDSIEEDIKEGLCLFVDEEIADECGFGSDEGTGWKWEEMYEEFHEYDEDENED